MSRTRTITLSALVLCLVLVACASAQSGPVLVLVNPGLEPPYTVREASEVEVANGWDYSYMQGDDRWCRAPCFRPEMKPETEIAVSGSSQRWFTTFARHYTAIHQSIAVEPGRWYRFTCWAYAISEPDGQLAVRVGANPWNAGPFDSTMIWGQQQPWGQYREWHELEVVFQAWGDRVRVAAGSVPNYPVKNNAAYIDDCRIEAADGPGPNPTPQPTQTPQPTPGPCPTCPAGGSCNYDTIRGIVREELDATTWGSVR